MQQILNLPYKIKRAAELYTRLYVLGHTPTLIYCTGRVGSIALYNALNAHGVFALKVENLNPNAERRQRGTSYWTYNHIAKPRRPAKVIFVVRNPLALMVSDFLPKLPYMTDTPTPYETLSVQQMSDIFNTVYFQQDRHLEKLNWFHDQAEPYLGIDVYAHPFPQDQGYTQFQSGGYDVIIIRTELNDATKNRVVGEFVGVDDLTITRANVGERKDYGAVYRDFKNTLTLDPAHTETIFNSAYARHFYGPQRLRQMNARWLSDASQP